MFRIMIVPVGWGFMAIQMDYSHNYAIITDGGSLRLCYSDALNTVKAVFQKFFEWPFSLPWIWILSHMDYDHFSIVVKLIENEMLPKPSKIILPASYSQDVCREALANYFALAEIITYKVGISPPRYVELFNVLSKSPEKIGVSSNTIISAGDLEYRIIWPDIQYVGKKCGELHRFIREKINKVCGDDSRCKDIAKEVIDNIRGKIDDLRIKNREDYIDLSILSDIKSRNLEGSYQSTKVIVFEKNHRTTNLKGSPNIETFTEIAEKLNDYEFYRITYNIQNLHSLAYIVERKHYSKMDINVYNYDRRHSAFHYDYDFYNYEDRLVEKYKHPLLLYLSDLKNKELNHAIRNVLSIADHVLVKIAPHHGNSYSELLNKIKSFITYIPRCESHVPRNWKTSSNYKKYLHSKSEELGSIITSKT